MKATELRIGNWVKWNGENHTEYALIASICNEEVGFRCGDYGSIKDIEGILINDYLLNKFGFISKNGSATLFLSNDIYWNNKTLRIDTYFTNKILFAHQLQNIYFALTGKELEYNLKNN